MNKTRRRKAKARRSLRRHQQREADFVKHFARSPGVDGVHVVRVRRRLAWMHIFAGPRSFHDVRSQVKYPP